MSTSVQPTPKQRLRSQNQREGIELVLAMAALMWFVEIVNTIDSNRISNGGDGIVARNLPHLWGIFTAPFIHASFQHLISNTIPFLFMGVIIGVAGAARVGLVTLIVIVIGGVGTWLIAPAGTDTIGASGVVFGYATYLLTRGIFDRSVLELMTGAVVAVVWGGVLLASLVPQPNVSWQGHVCGGIAGVIAAYLLSGQRAKRSSGLDATPGTGLTRLP
jgi:membrane associated rhomboid family serine protease